MKIAINLNIKIKKKNDKSLSLNDFRCFFTNDFPIFNQKIDQGQQSRCKTQSGENTISPARIDFKTDVNSKNIIEYPK